ncbi:5-Enolpyruvylshikimate-3-phosphate synthase [Chitinispirillum alkaliphilum]|nr:5-Enolpyruvylshikimate-3-phosphate synthase [Chitinispirillum alkaliphilum]
MKWIVRPSKLSGSITVPPSKSHTIRAILISALAEGRSVIRNPLIKGDGNSAICGARSLGARVELQGDTLYVEGIGGDYSGGSQHFDMGNSGTGTTLFASVAALGSKMRRFDGDESLRSRPVKPLLEALCALGATCDCEGSNSDLPFTVRGPIRGGKVSVDGISSQFVSSLLLACPLVSEDTHITVNNLHEHPYVEMTLWWLEKQNIEIEYSQNLTSYNIAGGQAYKPFDIKIPCDFSSATFSAVAAAVTKGSVVLNGTDFTDPQGDKIVFDILSEMGASINKGESSVKVGCGSLKGAHIDLNTIPDSLPALSIAACLSEGETYLSNVAQARIKETDRIAVMNSELSKMGATVRELPDGLVIRKSDLRGTHVSGHHDHRVVMALALAGMVAQGETVIDNAEAAAVTYPTFVEDFKAIGADISVVE